MVEFPKRTCPKNFPNIIQVFINLLITRDNFLDKDNQTRHSVLNPFITKKGEFEKNKDALDQYREKWTKSRNVYDHSRTYLGANNNKK